MDQDAIVEAVGRHLDTIEIYRNAIALLAVAAAWAGIRRSSAPALCAAASSTAVERTAGNALGIAVGGLIFVAANRLQARFLGAKQRAG